MSTFDLYMMGAEQKGWRDLLAASAITNVGISYWSLRKRMPRRGVDIASFGFDSVLLDSGGYTANAKPEQLTPAQWATYCEEYGAFALAHIEDIDLVTEFDYLGLGNEWISHQRKTVWSQVDPEKFLPVWHPEQGLPELELLAENYPRIAIAENAITGAVNITIQLNTLARRGIKLHGLAMTKPSVLRQVAFATAASTSWISPMKYGDTIVWDNNDLTRYPVKMKTQARLRHASLFEREGFDVAKIQADDHREVTRVALWAWRQQEQALRTLRMDERTSSPVVPPAAPNTSAESPAPDLLPAREVRELVPAPPTIHRADDELKMLPVMGLGEVERIDPSTRETAMLPILEMSDRSIRKCNDCVIKARCEAFQEHHSCAYKIPIKLATGEQRRAFLSGMVEMQGSRVLFGYMVEQANGGYPDPNLSGEFDRLLKAISTQADLEDGRDFFKISIEGRGNTGALSRLFGAEPVEAAREMARPPVRIIDADETDAIMARMADGQDVLEPAKKTRKRPAPIPG